MNIVEELTWRGLIKDVSNHEELVSILSKPTTIYCGFDPSATSMHLGNYVPISVLMRLQRAGHRIIAVVGGATGMIGDPSGKSKERNLLDKETLMRNTDAIRAQLSRFLDVSDPQKGLVINNYDWLGRLSMIDYLRDYGKYFPINVMLAKDVVANRLEQGISYTEFSYMMLQSIDFYHLYTHQQCQIQFGGSDQWGNLTSGLELIRKATDKPLPAAVFTTPLITRSDGKKFGKSEDGALFLDATLTSPYTLYQYFYNVNDTDAIRYLEIFSFLDQQAIREIQTEHEAALGRRIGQKALAEQIVSLIHGPQGLEEAQRLTNVFFTGAFQTLSSAELLQLFSSSMITVDASLALEDVLVISKAASSKREAREFIQGSSITINGETITTLGIKIHELSPLHEHYYVLRRGKKLYYFIRVQ
jgi:tyrosyl-tRNA synthetase